MGSYVRLIKYLLKGGMTIYVVFLQIES